MKKIKFTILILILVEAITILLQTINNNMLNSELNTANKRAMCLQLTFDAEYITKDCEQFFDENTVKSYNSYFETVDNEETNY